MRDSLTNFVLSILAVYRRLMESSFISMSVLFIPGFEGLRWEIGRLKARKEHLRALRDVPAYRDLVSRDLRRRGKKEEQSSWDAIPVIDKVSYIRKYSPAECCHGGVIPAKGIMIDESSGSTGMPNNWVRSRAERAANKRMLEFGLGHLIGNGPRFIINAFSLSSWATGVNVAMAFSDSSILKSLGPDVAKIDDTFAFFGKSHKYVVMAYPSFLKTLVDTARVDWSSLDVTFIFGGDPMSESMRNYILARGVSGVYGSYGATDLELNMASENSFTISLRKLLEENKALASRIVQYPGATPMIFQYNPMDFHIESTADGELLISLCRPTYLAPKVRYNIHDRGHVVRMPQLKKLLKESGIDIRSLGKPSSDLPLLFHYGRADMSVAFFGCSISPSDVQEALFRVPELASRVNAFTIVTYENESVDKRVAFALECLPNTAVPDLHSSLLRRRLVEELKAVNLDFREAMSTAGAGAEPSLEIHAYRTGPFVNGDVRIKLNYVTRIIELRPDIASAV